MVNYAMIPLAAVLLSAAFGAVSVVWNSERRATGPMGAIFLCTGLWALVDLCTYIQPDASQALAFMRWAQLPALMIGPATLWVTAELIPVRRATLMRQARVGSVLCFAAGVGMVVLPGNIDRMVAADFGGWMPVYGPVTLVMMPIGCLLPGSAFIAACRVGRSGQVGDVDRQRAWAVKLCVALSVGMVLSTEWAMPLLEIPTPRLGALCISLSAALLWMNVLHAADDLAATPQGVARAVLAELHDGVVLVDPGGTVLSANTRFVQLSGRRRAKLMGSSIGDVLAAPVARVCEGVEDRKTAVHLPDGRTIPISVSSSRILNRSGGAIGVVVVCRDLRDVDALRNQLLSSGRLAAVGELAAGIAHEVNNPVAFMRADLNLLAERIDELRGYVAASDRPDEDLMIFERSRRRVRNAIAGIERVTEVVRDVREFAHVGGAGQGGSDPESVIRGAMRLARLQRGDEVELRLTSSTCDERIDSGQELKQVTLALLRMLVTAAAKGSRLEVDLRTDSQDLVLGLSTGPLADSAGDLLSRFDVLGDQGLAGSPDEYGLGVAVELVEQLGGGLAIEATRSDAVRIEVSMPIHFGTISS